MIIRPGSPADAPQIVALLQEIVDAGGTTAIEGTVPATFIGDILDGSRDKSACFVAELNGEVLGFQYFSADRNDPSLAIIATFAKRGGTQRGIGSSLFAETRKAATAKGFREIDATIRADNTGGLTFYGRMGFVDFSVEKGVPMMDGTPVDRISKRLTL